MEAAEARLLVSKMHFNGVKSLLWIMPGFFNTEDLSSNRGFLTYAKHYHREINYQLFGETKKMAHRELELKSTSS